MLWIPYRELLDGIMPSDNWICLATATNAVDLDAFGKWVQSAVEQGLLEFKGHGTQGELLHDTFDMTMVHMEIDGGHDTIEVTTTWHNAETLRDVLWQCFFATALPDHADYDRLCVVCTDMDDSDRSSELTAYIHDFQDEDERHKLY